MGSVNKRKKHGMGESSGVGPRRVMEPTRSAAPEHKGLMTPGLQTSMLLQSHMPSRPRCGAPQGTQGLTQP